MLLAYIFSPQNPVRYERQLVIKCRRNFYKTSTLSAISVSNTEKNEGYFVEDNFLRHIPETARGSIDTLSSGFTQTKNAAPQGCYGGSDMNN